jgi:3-oxoacyl-[acyl-carrier protein] reductase
MTNPLDAEPEYDLTGLGFPRDAMAVVTGAASGIGRSVARMLARSGVTVHAWDLDLDGLKNLADDVAGLAGQLLLRRVDTSDSADVVDAWWETTDSPVQYLVNNAGPASNTALSVEDGVRQAIGGYAAVTGGLLQHHAEHAQSVTFTASTAGNFMVGPTPDWYPAAKAGIVGYTRHLAVKLRGTPRCNAVAPGATVTPRTAAAFTSDVMVEKLARYPMGRAAYPWEVATVICFLLSPAASFVNGVVIPVEGASTWIQ